MSDEQSEVETRIRDLAAKILDTIPSDVHVSTGIAALTHACTLLMSASSDGNIGSEMRIAQIHVNHIVRNLPSMCAAIAAQNATPKTETIH